MPRPGPKPGRPKKLEGAATVLITKLKAALEIACEKLAERDRLLDHQAEQLHQSNMVLHAALLREKALFARFYGPFGKEQSDNELLWYRNLTISEAEYQDRLAAFSALAPTPDPRDAYKELLEQALRYEADWEGADIEWWMDKVRAALKPQGEDDNGLGK